MPEHESARSQAKRAQIRRGASRVFLAEGFTGATTDAIANAAGVSKQTLYVYYRDKEQLIVDVLTSLLTELNRDQKVLEGSRPVTSAPELRTALIELASGMLEAISGPMFTT
jgi:TetR/AcrR family transcriptional regulator, mexJK operon transcriptional repressor